MSLREKLMEDMKEAMRSGDRTKLSVIRLLRSAITYEELARKKPLDDQDVLELVSRQVRQRRESIEEFRRGNRHDLVAKEEAELAVLASYLPKQLTREELVELAKAVIEEVGAKGPADKGKVMGRLMPQVRGRAEGSQVNAIVTELLSAGT
jgi:hypothetical protein